MATVALVGHQIDDGLRLKEELVADGGSVTLAFWAKSAEDGQWFLYIATDSLERDGPAAAYRAVYDTVRKLGNIRVGMSEIKLVAPNSPIVKNILSALARHPGPLPVQFTGEMLGDSSVEEVYVYPRNVTKVTIYGLTFRGDPTGALHLAFEPQNPNSSFTVEKDGQRHTYPADTSMSWMIAAPEGSTLERDEIGRLVLAWSLYGKRTRSDANEVLSLARLGLHGFRVLRQPA